MFQEFRAKFLIIVNLFLVESVSNAQPKSPKSDTVKSDNVYLQINDTLFASQYEVSNIQFKNFLSTLGQSKEYDQFKVDNSKWYTNLNLPVLDIVAIATHYHINEGFNDYPVVNISHEAAIRYCNWLNAEYKKHHKSSKVFFRLPTANEWILLSPTYPDTDLSPTLLSGMNDKHVYLENIKPIVGDSIRFGADGGYFTVKCDSYWPNENGLYNLIGNVAEMTKEPNLQKGGSWFETLDDANKSKSQHYICPDPRVGFRVVAIVKTK